MNVNTRQNPRRHVVLKKQAKFVQYVHRLEGICLFIFTFASASFQEMIHFCRYVFHLLNKSFVRCAAFVKNFIVLKLMVTKFIRNKDYL